MCNEFKNMQQRHLVHFFGNIGGRGGVYNNALRDFYVVLELLLLQYTGFLLNNCVMPILRLADITS